MFQFLFLFIVFSVSLNATVVVITGASRGIGFAIADRLAQSGYTVYAGKRSTSTLKNLQPLAEKYSNVHLIDIDVTKQDEIDLAIKTIIDNEGRIDVLVNNAGIEYWGSIENISIEEAQKLFDVNYFGPTRMCQAVLPIMRKQMAGRIIQIGSRGGFRPVPSLSVYSATKFALEGISETMAVTLKPWNILVSLIEPGPVKTELDFEAPYGSHLAKDEDPYAEIFDRVGLLDPNSPIAQEPEEIACIVQDAIEARCPLFRYQTTDMIRRQAGFRMVDITGLSHVEEWNKILFKNDSVQPPCGCTK
ncbi:MAG: SDR family oxidoreductase [Verrucomicrobia bacterium]|nr:SDR family oxidoreductase [Verrucomicrobiota bacterium]